MKRCRGNPHLEGVSRGLSITATLCYNTLVRQRVVTHHRRVCQLARVMCAI
jgi:hypothetical protein